MDRAQTVGWVESGYNERFPFSLIRVSIFCFFFLVFFSFAWGLVLTNRIRLKTAGWSFAVGPVLRLQDACICVDAVLLTAFLHGAVFKISRYTFADFLR